MADLEIAYQVGRGGGIRRLSARQSSLNSFWSRVDQTGACWLWKGAKQANGYGRTKVAGMKLLVHRLAFTLKRGPIPDGLDLDHLCRNRLCVNPAHLEPVTNLENCRRGRQPLVVRGELNSTAKLTAAAVLEIRRLCASGLGQREIAKRFDVKQPTVSAINTRRIWAHLEGAQ